MKVLYIIELLFFLYMMLLVPILLVNSKVNSLNYKVDVLIELLLTEPVDDAVPKINKTKVHFAY
jgi:hypothetical protein